MIKISVNLTFHPSTFGRKKKENIARVREAFLSFSKLEAEIKNIGFVESDNELEVSLSIDNLDKWRIIEGGKRYKTLLSVCNLFLSLNGFEKKVSEVKASTPMNLEKTYGATTYNKKCEICKLGYTEQDIQYHENYHFKHVIFCLEHNYDFGISKSVLRDTAKWKLEEVLRNKRDLPLNMKVILSLDLLKGEYIYNGGNFLDDISFEKYAIKELKENTRKHNDKFNELGVSEVLYGIFKI